MFFQELVQYFADRPFFELKELREVARTSESQLANQLSQWTQQGKVLRLRRGKYLLRVPYRKFTPSTYYVANYLYRPSYVSLSTALQHYGLIPEAVAMTQSVTPRHGREWTTDLGPFSYRSIKRERFWGYREEVLDRLPAQNRFMIARPEKALLDLIYLQKGEWTRERLREMRFQSIESLDPGRLQQYAERFDSPKVSRATDRFLELYWGEFTGER
ncbi:MAG: hypothetical protein ACLFWL_17620 [Candidatus Brocadiia bacterium]